MSQTIVIENFPDSNVSEMSYLTIDALLGQAKVNIENADNVNADDYVIIGLPGDENSEIKQVNSLSSLEVTLKTNLLTSHFKNDPFTVIRANQAKIYRAVNVDGSIPDDSDFSEIATITLEADQLSTEYVDTSGGDGYWYKYTFYNQTSQSETDIADAIAVRGGNYGMYATVEEVRNEAGLSGNRWITDRQIMAKLDQAQSEVDGSLIIGGYDLPLANVPEMVKNATLLLAAGYLLSKEYGPEHTGTNKDGQLKIKMGRDILTKIENGLIALVDPITKAEISQGESGISGFPDATTEDTDSERKFSVEDVW